MMMFIQMSVFSQERTLIKNEMGTRDRQELNVERYRRGASQAIERGNQAVRQTTTTTTSNRINDSFNYSYARNAGAEMRLFIADNGYYTVEINNQLMASPYGRFHFFDIPNGRNLLSIYEDGYLIYRANVFVQSNRMVNLEFQKRTGLFEIFTPVVGGGNHYSPYYSAEVTANEFSDMLRHINRNTSFDDDRMRYIRTMKVNRYFTSNQIATLVKALSFDKNKLIMAKELYLHCINPHNYYEVFDMISYTSNKRDLEKYIQQQNTIRR